MPGSWRKRGKDSYQLEVCIGTDFRRKPNMYRKTVHCKSEAQAEKELALFYAACQAGNVSASTKFTVESLTTQYLENYVKPKVNRGIAPSTYAKYSSNIRTHINPVIGSVKLTKLSPVHIDEWLNYLRAYQSTPKSEISAPRRLSDKTITDLYFLLKTMLDYAVTRDMLEKNPCDKVNPPKFEKAEADFYNFDELNLMMNELLLLDDSRYLPHKVYIFLDLFTGLRGAELDGLTWSDIDFANPKLGIVRNRRYVPGFGVVEGATKTKNSRREVSIPKICLLLLERLKDQQKQFAELSGDKWIQSDYVFVNHFGEPYHPRSIAKWFPDFLESRGLRRITLHKLRHTHVSLLNYLDVNEEEISRRVGHADSNITRRTYMHIFKDNSQDISEKLDSFFGNISDKL